MDSSRHVSEDQMSDTLAEAFKGDPEQSVLWQIAQKVADPIQPEDKRGRRRIHPLLVTLGLFTLIIIGTFIYFGVFHHE